MRVPVPHGPERGLRRRAVHVGVPDLACQRVLAPAHAGRTQDPDFARLAPGAQGFREGVRARELAREAVADPDRERGGRRLAPRTGSKEQ